MQLSTLFDIVTAAHLTAYVDSPFESRGGLILVAYGESLKTSVLEVLEFYHPSALVQTDLTVQGVAKLRDRIAIGQIHSLVLTDFQKIYERHVQVASNVEGTLRAMVAEGFTSLAFQEQQINRPKARALVMGAITPAFMEKQFARWAETGFARRFLFPTYTLANPDALVESVIHQKLIDFGRGVIQVPRNKKIPFRIEVEESERLNHMIRYQYGTTIPLQLMQKIYAVLKWMYAESGRSQGAADAQARDVVADFAPALTKEGTKLEVTFTAADVAASNGHINGKTEERSTDENRDHYRRPERPPRQDGGRGARVR